MRECLVDRGTAIRALQRRVRVHAWLVLLLQQLVLWAVMMATLAYSGAMH